MKAYPWIAFAVAMCAMPCAAIETEEVDLREGTASDGQVRIYRSFDRLVLEDSTTSKSLEMLAAAIDDHGALTGLADDDHGQYLNTNRHEGAHTSGFNAALALPADVDGNETLGGHVADTDIHLDRADSEAISGEWNFEAGMEVLSGGLRLGTGQSSPDAALLFEDGTEDAEWRYDPADGEFQSNRPLSAPSVYTTQALRGDAGGTPTAVIEGFSSIGGIAPADLLASTAQESISGSWTFLAELDAAGGVVYTVSRETGIPESLIKVENGGASGVGSGDVVIWAGVGSNILRVEKLASAMSASSPFAGIAKESAAAGESFHMVKEGVAETVAGDSISTGQRLTWSGTGMVPLGATAGYASLGYALEPANTGEPVRVYIDRVEFDP